MVIMCNAIKVLITFHIINLNLQAFDIVIPLLDEFEKCICVPKSRN